MYYKLDDQRNVVPTTINEWVAVMKGDRRVALTELPIGVTISTVFLGLDHDWGNARPVVFETMIFGGEHDQYQDRCSTWEEAEAMHLKACELVKSSL